MFPQQSIHGLQKQPPHRLQRMKSHGETKEIMFPFLSFLPALLLLHYNNHPPSPQPPQQSTSDLIKTKRHIIIITFALHKTETIFLCNNCSPTRGDIKICRPSVWMHCLSVSAALHASMLFLHQVQSISLRAHLQIVSKWFRQSCSSNNNKWMQCLGAVSKACSSSSSHLLLL